MANILLKDLDPMLHARLRVMAEHHHRSMNSEIICILERELGVVRPVKLPPPVVGRRVGDAEALAERIRRDRDGRR